MSSTQRSTQYWVNFIQTSIVNFIGSLIIFLNNNLPESISKRLFPKKHLLDNRTVYFNNIVKNKHFCSNLIKNTKFTPLNFIFKFFWEQFGRFMNAYFLLIACLQLNKDLTPVNPITTWTPLLIIFTISAIKELYDDYNRYLNDLEFNNRLYLKLDPTGYKSIKSSQIKVGDIIKIEEGGEAPCDLVILNCINTSDPNTQTAFIQTANLDGETSLKPRIIPPRIADLSEESLLNLEGIIECPLPNPNFNDFNSRIIINPNRSDSNSNNIISVSSSQLIPQGSFLVQTTSILGIVVYTGRDTKIGQNSQNSNLKLSVLDKQIERASVFIFIFMLFLTVLLGYIGNYWHDEIFRKVHKYLHLDPDHKLNWYTGLVIPLRMLLLLSLMIPISLKVSMDISKFLCSQFIGWDLKLYDKSRGPAVVNNTQIPDELGQVQFVLSDKTGTLTENVMNLRKCSISGKRYGNLQQDIWESEALMIDMDEMQSSVTENPLLRNSVESNTFLDNMSVFFQSISLCHDSQLIPLEDSETDTRTDHEYYGSSPDEVALLNSAAKLGYKYLEEAHDGTITLDAHGKVQTYELLHKLDFCSFRKRMSVLVRVSKDSPIWLICKGADDSVVPLCKSVPLPRPFHQESSTSITQLHLDEYAHLGLRTLAIACKSLSEDEYKQWLNKFETANSSIEDREDQIRQSYIDIEKDLNLIGCTAIEDKLQPGVPDTIASLRQAGVKVWMLTGDKLITAIQIGRSCKLLPPEGFGRIIKLQGRDQTFEEFFENFEDEYSQLSSNIPDISIRSRLSLGLLSSTLIQNDISLASMIVDGTGLAYILSDFRLKSMFVELGLRVNSVICCRATPKQKSQVVELIKSLNQITLAIGDGGNDVLMIQQANIGVGIRGLEGKQATRAADITLSRFSHLNRLILIHGRYSLHRVRFVALYCFYKTVYICCIQAVYQFFSGFNGTSLFNTYSLSLYNILYAGMPVLFYVLDKDIPEEQLIKYPTLYKFTQGRDPSYWFISGTFRWFLWAVGQGIVTIIVSYGSFFEFTDTWFSSSDSMVIDSFLMYSIVIIIIQITLSLFTNYYTIVNQFVIWGTIIIYFVTTLLASIPVKLHMSEVQQLVMDTRFYLCIMLTIVICSVPVWVYNYFKLVSGKDPVKELRNSVISVRPRTVAHS